MPDNVTWTPERIQALADRLGGLEDRPDRGLEALALALDVSFYTVTRWTRGLFCPDKRNAKALDEAEACYNKRLGKGKGGLK